MKGDTVEKEYGNSRTFTEKRSTCHVEKHHSILQLVLIASANIVNIATISLILWYGC